MLVLSKIFEMRKGGVSFTIQSSSEPKNSRAVMFSDFQRIFPGVEQLTFPVSEWCRELPTNPGIWEQIKAFLVFKECIPSSKLVPCFYYKILWCASERLTTSSGKTQNSWSVVFANFTCKYWLISSNSSYTPLLHDIWNLNSS